MKEKEKEAVAEYWKMLRISPHGLSRKWNRQEIVMKTVNLKIPLEWDCELYLVNYLKHRT